MSKLTESIKINGKSISVPLGLTILDACRKLNIQIPTLCYLDGLPHYTSCMLCVVQDMNSGKLLPACSTSVKYGMNIETSNPEIIRARKTTLELLFSEHVGDCRAPCKQVCPAAVDIQDLFTKINAGEIQEAIKNVYDQLVFPGIISRICSAPCESGCRRKLVDSPMPIRKMVQNLAKVNFESESCYIPNCDPTTGKSVAIIGGGAFGLSCACYLLRNGHSCTIFEKEHQIGGKLINEVAEGLLSKDILEQDFQIISKIGAVVKLDCEVGADILWEEITSEFDAVIIAVGENQFEEFALQNLNKTKSGLSVNQKTFETSIPKIFIGGGAIKSGKNIARTVFQGQVTANSVHQFLKGKILTGIKLRFNSAIGRLKDGEAQEFVDKINTDPRETTITHSKNETSSKIPFIRANECLQCGCAVHDNCMLRQFADEYHVKQRKYKSTDRNNIVFTSDHPEIIYEPGKCIKCSLCIRITENEREDLGLTFIGRGFDVQVGVPLNKSLSQGLKQAARKCAEACPTGALVLKINE